MPRAPPRDATASVYLEQYARTQLVAAGSNASQVKSWGSVVAQLAVRDGRFEHFHDSRYSRAAELFGVAKVNVNKKLVDRLQKSQAGVSWRHLIRHLNYNIRSTPLMARDVHGTGDCLFISLAVVRHESDADTPMPATEDGFVLLGGTERTEICQWLTANKACTFFHLHTPAERPVHKAQCVQANHCLHLAQTRPMGDGDTLGFKMSLELVDGDLNAGSAERRSLRPRGARWLGGGILSHHPHR